MKNKEYLEENRRAYNQMALAYKQRADSGEFEVYPDIVEFGDLLSVRFGNPWILDIGPGAGVFLDYFSRRGFITSAIDISEEMIRAALKRSPNTNKSFIGNFLDYDFRNRKFDGLFAKAIFHLFAKEDSFHFIQKSYELLENQGLLYLSVFLRDYSREGLMPKNMKGKEYVRFSKDWTEGELEKLLGQSSFKLLKTFILP